MIFHDLLLRFLFGSSTLMFAAGSVALGGDAGAAADTTNAGAGEAAGDTTVDETAGEDQGAAEAGAEVEGAEATETREVAAKTGEDKVDWRTVPQAVRNHLAEIKKTDPKLANLLQNAVYTSQTMLREAPGGLKEIRDLKQIVDEAGGAEEIRSMRDTHRAVVEEQEDLDRRAMAGDPAVLDNLEDIAGAEGFAKLMPVALDRWMQKNPAEYSHAMAGVMVAALNEGGVVSNLNMAIELLGLGTPEAIALGNKALAKATDYLNSVGKIASTVPEKPKVDPQIAEQQKDLDNQKAAVFNDRFADRFSSWRNPEILRGLTELAPKGKTFTDYQKGIFVRGVVDELKGILAADNDYTSNLQRIYNTRSLEDLLKFAKSRTEKLLPEAKKKVYRQLFTEATLGSPKPKPQPGAPKPGAAGAGQPAVKGWTRVAADKAPKPDQIDQKATTFEMKFKKGAVTLDGRKVYWGDKPPA